MKTQLKAAVLSALLGVVACQKDVKMSTLSDAQQHTPISLALQKEKTDIPSVLFEYPVDYKTITIKNNEKGGTFEYRPISLRLEVDSALVFKAGDGGFWERKISDTIKLAWYNISSENNDNAPVINRAVQSAIIKHAKVLTLPENQVFKVATSNYFTVPDDFNLKIDGHNSTLLLDEKAVANSQEAYVMAFRCSDINSTNSGLNINELNIKAPGIKPKWTNRNYAEHRLAIAIETDNIFNIKINHCNLTDIYGYGIRLKNFVNVNIDHVVEINVGGHFPVENEYDSFGDGVWLGHYDVGSLRASRKKTFANITNCQIFGYSFKDNGGFASRCGITVEGFRSYANDIEVKVNVSNTKISEYDRNIHVEGISADIVYTDCTLSNFFGIALVASSPKTILTYNNTTATGILKPNPQQEHYGLGGIMQFGSALDVHMLNGSIFTFDASAVFRANLYVSDGSTLDLGNCDVFFDHADLHFQKGAKMINVPASVDRGFNMYGGTIDFDQAVIAAGNKGRKGVFHGENINSAFVNNCRLENSRLLFNGMCGYLEFN